MGICCVLCQLEVGAVEHVFMFGAVNAWLGPCMLHYECGFWSIYMLMCCIAAMSQGLCT